MPAQVIEHHSEFLRKVLKGCLLSRKLTLLQSLMHLKKQASHFTQLSQALQVQPNPADSTALDTASQGTTAFPVHC